MDVVVVVIIYSIVSSRDGPPRNVLCTDFRPVQWTGIWHHITHFSKWILHHNVDIHAIKSILIIIFIYLFLQQVRRPSNKRATVVAFLGIPYALPPVGSRRFQVFITKKALLYIKNINLVLPGTDCDNLWVDDLVQHDNNKSW